MTVTPTDSLPLVAMPLPDDWVIVGVPSPRGRVLVTSPDGGQVAGVWECDAGTFRYRHRAAETIRIDSGEVAIHTDDGGPQTLRVGDMAHFPAGSESIWSVPRFVRKTFFLLKSGQALQPSSHEQAQG